MAAAQTMTEIEKEDKDMARCVIVSAGPVSPALAGLLQPDDYLIACDAGYRSCAALGRRPDAVVGDFDSAPRPDVPPEEKMVVLPHVKDDTDTEYAAKLAFEMGFRDVLLLGCLGGGRMEHTLANIATGLGLAQRGARAVLQDERSRLSYLLPGESRVYPKGAYFYLSVFPLEGRAKGVKIRGAFYELTDAVLTAGYPLGVSNEYAPGSDAITLGVEKGALLVVETKAD